MSPFGEFLAKTMNCVIVIPEVIRSLGFSRSKAAECAEGATKISAVGTQIVFSGPFHEANVRNV